MVQFILDFFFPRRSLFGTEGKWLTEQERRALQVRPYVEWTEDLRARNIHHLDHLVAACPYKKSSVLQKAIHTFKYKRIRMLSLDLAHMISESATHVGRPLDGVICPVPLHWTRVFSRGFNQSEELAKHVSQQLHLPSGNFIKRKRPTGHQAWRSRSERLRALAHAFQVVRSEKVPRRIILIDDLCTTGTTLDECARVLKEAGAQWVEAWVVAQG